ncbi:MAG TPA: hypothetical protein VFS08_20350 [Gemmatimonadaceae bacterium]|nr:hypothetical protein [Gemmatimonadaceae bacterium]
MTPRDTVRRGRDTTAVPIPARPDSATADTTARRDTTAARDTVLPPIARAPRPAALGLGGDYVWDRAAIFASGAMTLTDLLERVPGVTGFRTSWLVTPELITYAGSFQRVRLFYDGVELDPLDPRTAGLQELSKIPLWTLEEVAVERAAGELRVHLRSWRVTHTTPATRFDVATGEFNTNLFRGFYGRRFRGGQALQAGFQQFSTTGPFGGDGDQLALFARGGWAGRVWSVDAFVQRTRRLQESQSRRFERADLPRLEGAAQLAYLRVGYRDPDAEGLWAQLIASTQSFDETTEAEPARDFGIPADSADTTRARPQYVAHAGWTRGALRVAASTRLRAFEGETFLSPAARAAFFTDRVQAQLHAERAAEDSSTLLDGELRFTPLERVAASVAASRRMPDGRTGRETEQALRGEVGVRVGRTWLVGGLLARDGGATGAPIVFDPSFLPAAVESQQAVYGAVRGPVYRDVSVDLVATQWTDGGASSLYRPHQQLHGQLTLDTRWLGRFPSGEFGFKASVVMDYRSATTFPVGGSETIATLSSTILSGLIEVRIQDAVAYLQARNFLALQYEQVPGFLMPRNLLVYGVRWQFWN